MPAKSNLLLGLNLFGRTAGVNMKPGEATDAVNLIPRPDGSLLKHWGARKLNTTQLTNGGAVDPVIGIAGFTYRGKNNDTGANPGRGGNFGLSDDGSIFTLRDDFYSGGLVLTEDLAYRWEPADRSLQTVAFPAGFTVGANPRPTCIVLQNNVYIIGYGSHNLRYDPCDEALYIIGWDSTPTLTGGSITLAAGGNLQVGTYKYRASWVNMYTGEQSSLSDPIERTTTAANKTVSFAAGAFSAYAGTRHFKDAGNPTNQDIGLVLYRTEVNQDVYHFLALINPALATATLTDNGLATDKSRRGQTSSFQDPVVYSSAAVYRNVMYGISWSDGDGTDRLYYNDFTTTKSHFERTEALNYMVFPMTTGEVLTAIVSLDQGLIVFSNRNAYFLTSRPNLTTGRISHLIDPLEWGVGAVGPKAVEFRDGWIYFLSKRGMYRWQPGIATPQWIGKNLAHMFLDLGDGMCRLDPENEAKAEVFYDPDADVVRFTFPTGGGNCIDNGGLPNQHVYWYNRPEIHGAGPEHGWFFGQPKLGTWAYTHAFGRLDPDTGAPESQFNREPRVITADNNGFLYEYEPGLETFGLPEAHPGRFIVFAGTTTTAQLYGGGLDTTDDGLKGIRWELVRLASGDADGSIESGVIASNTNDTITFEETITAPADGDLLYIGGFPCYWRSWLDHMGDPTMHKMCTHFWLGLHPVHTDEKSTMDVTLAAGDNVPGEPTRTRNVKANLNQQKMLASLTGRWFFWEFANSRPYEPFCVTFIDMKARMLGRRRI